MTLKRTIQNVILIPALAAVALLCLKTARGQQNLAQDITKNVRIDQNLDAQVPLDTPFVDENGKTIPLSSCFGQKPVVLVMPFYKCAGMCSLELDGMAKVFNAMQFSPGKEFNVVTVSIDPREQYLLAQQKKKDYMSLLAPDKRVAGSQGWHFLTGSDASIHRVADAVGFHYLIDPKTQQPIHAVGIMILTPQGKVSRYLLGVDYSPRDLRLALVDASDNKIGGLADKFTLLCSHFDPTTSKYGVAIDRIIKFACTLTILILGSFIFGLSRFEKKRSLQQAKTTGTSAPV